MYHFKLTLFTLMLPAWGLFSSTAIADVDVATANSALPNPNVKSWVKIKREGVVMQEHENTCGSAAIATLLNGFYGKQITEKDVLDSIGTTQATSPVDLSRYLIEHNYPLEGKKSPSYYLKLLSYDEEGLFKYSGQPTIILLRRNTETEGHWVVLRGAHPQYGVIIADPTLGNLQVSTNDFKQQWITTKCTDGSPCGKAIILKTPPTNLGYFKQPQPYENPITRW